MGQQVRRGADKKWREVHPELWAKQKRRYYQKTAFASGGGRGWTIADLKKVLLPKSQAPSDSELAAEMHRSVAAIQIVRHRYRERGESSETERATEREGTGA